MESVVLPSWHPDTQPVDAPDPMDSLEKAEWLITACGAGFMVALVMILVALN